MVLPLYAPTYGPYVDTTHQQSKQHRTNRRCNLTVTFWQELYKLGYACNLNMNTEFKGVPHILGSM